MSDDIEPIIHEGLISMWDDIVKNQDRTPTADDFLSLSDYEAVKHFKTGN